MDSNDNPTERPDDFAAMLNRQDMYSPVGVVTGGTLLFLKVANLSPRREIEINHIWFELAEGQQLHLRKAERPLLARLRLDVTYETWLPVAWVSGSLDWAVRFRVKRSSGAVIMSRLNKSVPLVGYVAVGGESPYLAPRRDTEPAGFTGIGPGKIKDGIAETPAAPQTIHGAPQWDSGARAAT